ncbi:MAG: hypothetical protein D3908_11955 [Candidatus Electrothrix sp. AUS4]|nr:hypothetical protein [Candidatus Electrothrix sp. AUS4]
MATRKKEPFASQSKLDNIAKKINRMSSSTLYFLRFFIIVLGVHALMHYYFWLRMVRDPALRPSCRIFGTAAVLALFLLLPVSRILLKQFSFHQVYPLLWFAYLWLGILMLFFFFVY